MEQIDKDDVICVLLSMGPVIGRVVMEGEKIKEVINPCNVFPVPKGVQIQQMIGVPEVLNVREEPMGFYKIKDKGIINSYIQVTGKVQVVPANVRIN